MHVYRTWRLLLIGLLTVHAAWLHSNQTATAQTLELDLQSQPLSKLATQAKQQGDAARGAIVFFQQAMVCSKCHAVTGQPAQGLGPDLAAAKEPLGDEGIVEALLWPSKSIRRGFEAASVVTADSVVLTGLLVERSESQTTLRDASGKELRIPAAEIEKFALLPQSIMPAGQVNQLSSAQQFFDLVRYLFEIRDGGVKRAAELQPSATLLTLKLPDYESRIDHAGLIGGWNDESLARGEAIYRRVCANCHGTATQAGSLPTAPRFAEGKFKNGSDPLAMYNTLTRGFGFMAAQTWMVPSQKYDVIHYIRESYLRANKSLQLNDIDASYLAGLPKGDTRGPEPSSIELWSAMDYGPHLTHAYETPGSQLNIAYKGVAIRLDPGAGGVARGAQWMIFDTDTLRVASAWQAVADAKAPRFIDWRDIQFNGEHGIHPRVVGDVSFVNSNGPGWADPKSGSFADDQRVEGRDQRRYGPLPRDWAKYRGLYHYDSKVILSYTVGNTEVLELLGQVTRATGPLPATFRRTFNIGPRDRELILQVAETELNELIHIDPPAAWGPAVAVIPSQSIDQAKRDVGKFEFAGQTFLETPCKQQFNLSQDYTIAARVKTKHDGSIFTITEPGPKWIPNGVTLFVRDGKLCFDIGWVGALTSQASIADGKWHDVAVTWKKATGRASIFIDGQADNEKPLAAKSKLDKAVARIGFTAPDFPGPEALFKGEIAEILFAQRSVKVAQRSVKASPPDLLKQLAADASLVARWLPSSATQDGAPDAGGRGFDAAVRAASETASMAPADSVLAGILPSTSPVKFELADGNLRMHVAAGPEPMKFTLWTAALAREQASAAVLSEHAQVVSAEVNDAELDLATMIHGGAPRWPQLLETQLVVGADTGPLAVDTLTAPESNPWLAQTRFTGLDFLNDGRIAACTWDGDVWLVKIDEAGGKLLWHRIASGMYQPLGITVLDDKIHLTCRDQLTVLHDLNGDEEIDFYQCLNNDHQVTEHFHEFAMGLQVDDAGNFYYAKSARHALPAVVPHHGTLLRVSRDGSHTDILANGFRAANGVCLNPDGSFLVTDQEGHWNPKNRINWVTLDPSGKPKFYGNMFGYHDIKDASDAAMEPPLCWITNAFDRSPAELLWVTSPRWGPLQGALLNLSYGYGKVFLVQHEEVEGLHQGGMIELPIPAFPTGVMRGRFRPDDQQLYLCGMFSWAGNATYPGGLYRIRATGQPIVLPVKLEAKKSGLILGFTEPLDPASVTPENFSVKSWSLKRTANYGSQHYDERQLHVRAASLSSDGKRVQLDVEQLSPTWCMEIHFDLRSSSGIAASGVINNTIHKLAE